LIDKGRHSGIIDIRYYRGAGCDADNYLVVVKVSSTSLIQELNDVDITEQYQVKISNRFAALEVFDDDDVNISRTGKML
jgi:hypothetical protein